MKKVTVRWVDSATCPGWQALRDADIGTIECETTGYLVKKDRKSVAIAMSRSLQSERACDFISIPRSCVRSIKVVGK